jgi:Tfp pilus assembly protein PilE
MRNVILLSSIKKSNYQSGVTLIELLLYMGIFSLLLMVFVQLFGGIVNVNLESQASSAVSQDSRYILNQMTYTLRQAKTIAQPAGFGTANAGSQLQFTTSGGTTYTYSLSADPVGQQKLMLSDGVNVEQLNSAGTTISNLLFTRLQTTGTSGESTVTISFTLTSTTRAQKGYQQETFQTTVGKR